jgi:trehalose 6-phosphate phosphatase
VEAKHDHDVFLVGLLRGERAANSAMLLDFDGSIAAIAPTPEMVSVPGNVVAALEVLHLRLQGALGLISGRRIAELDRFLAPLALPAAGLHGAEIRLSGVVETPAAPEGLAEAFRHVRRAAPHARSRMRLEDKGAAFALHWREDRGREADALALMQEAAAIAGEGFRLQRGSCVAELLPADANKGKALTRMMASAAFAGRRPIYCGDDLTDEAAFAAVNAAGGLSVKIGEGPTQAALRLPDAEALQTVLLSAAA